MKAAWKLLALGVSGLGLCGIVAAGAVVIFVTRDLPGYDVLAAYEPPVTTRVYARDGTLIGEYANERRLFVPIERIPPLVKAAFLSAEDKNFYSHSGVDILAIVRAQISNLRHGGRPQGASTITQQVVRKFLLSSEVTYTRKIREAVLAMRINNVYSKDEILEIYLNEIFLGANSYGVAAAAVNYFDKSLDELTISEVAYLAALPKGPSNYHPVHNRKAAVDRRNWVIDLMRKNDYLTTAAAEFAKKESLVTYDRPFGAVAEDVDYFIEDVRRFLYDKYGQGALYDGGLQARTTLDTRLQSIAVRALRDGLVAYDRRHGYRGPITEVPLNSTRQAAFAGTPNLSGVGNWRVALVTAVSVAEGAALVFGDDAQGRIPPGELAWARGPNAPAPGDIVYVETLPGTDQLGQFALRQIPEVNGAVVVLDPFTGHVRALSGGFSFGASEFNRATQAMRQPGSAFKPFVYAAALDNGFTPVSKVHDAPFSVAQGPGLPMWAPTNYVASEYLGAITLRRGLELSRNVMTARLAHFVGMGAVAETAERMGVYVDLPPLPSMSLGAGEVTLLRLTTGYAEFVNGGRKLEPILIDRIQDRNGATIYRSDPRGCADCNQEEWTGQTEPTLVEHRTQVLDPRTAYQIVSMLEGVVQRGTGASISAVGRPLAGKTGTSSDWRDAWFVGFSPDLVVGVFVGFDTPRSLGAGEAGSRTAAPIFRQFMTEALADQPSWPFRIPYGDGVVLVSVNPRTGEPTASGAPGSILEAFKLGTEPGAPIVVLDGFTRPPTLAGDATAITVSADAANVHIGPGTGGLY